MLCSSIWQVPACQGVKFPGILGIISSRESARPSGNAYAYECHTTARPVLVSRFIEWIGKNELVLHILLSVGFLFAVLEMLLWLTCLDLVKYPPPPKFSTKFSHFKSDLLSKSVHAYCSHPPPTPSSGHPNQNQTFGNNVEFNKNTHLCLVNVMLLTNVPWWTFSDGCGVSTKPAGTQSTLIPPGMEMKRTSIKSRFVIYWKCS